jgi:protein-S-isoprenylcysteine O-methyltransferase Ste14
MGIYAWASFSLGLKASNLTNRWIIIKGPYKYVRHPAYICKNTAWLIWGIPMVIVALESESLSIISVIMWLSWWAFIYYLRAITEENHLSTDPDYVEYKRQVPYKFIPKIW